MKTANERTTRISSEIILKNGDCRIYHAKSNSKKYAVKDVINFVQSIEEAIGDTVMWRFKGDKNYNLSTNYQKNLGLLDRIKRDFLGYFFDI